MFFLASKDEVFFYHYHDLVLRLASELPGALKAIRSDNGTEFKNAFLPLFVLSAVLSISSLLHTSLNKMALWKGRTGL